MKKPAVYFAAFLISACFFAGFTRAGAGDGINGFICLSGWWGGTAPPGTFVSEAADTGFTQILLFAGRDYSYVESVAAYAENYGIEVYPVITLGPAPWRSRHPGTPPPLQRMSGRENELAEKLRDDEYKLEINYQWGGEPVSDREVMVSEMLCFHDPRVVELLKNLIKRALEVPGVAGVAFDGFGYRNFLCCRCPLSFELFESYYKKNTHLTEDEALRRFSLSTLVEFNNELAEYARSVSPKAKINSHIYPVFEPEPLYGKMLDIDYCGQTAAWFFPWEPEKITRYARIISRDEKKFHDRANGVAMIGFYDNPPGFPVKSPKRLEIELSAILEGGCRRLQVANLNDVLETPEAARVFRKFMSKNQ